MAGNIAYSGSRERFLSLRVRHLGPVPAPWTARPPLSVR